MIKIFASFAFLRLIPHSQHSPTCATLNKDRTQTLSLASPCLRVSVVITRSAVHDEL